MLIQKNVFVLLIKLQRNAEKFKQNDKATHPGFDIQYIAELRSYKRYKFFTHNSFKIQTQCGCIASTYT